MSWYRLRYSSTGKLLSCEQIEKPEAHSYGVGPSTVVELEALNEEDAKRKAYNFYSAKKKLAAKNRNHSAGLCACSRKQDRPNTRTGNGFFKTCSVCAERQLQYEETFQRKKREGRLATGERDEAARVNVMQHRVRDRKKEIRLETLLEVRKTWENSKTNGEFTRWLKEEIKLALAPSLEAKAS